MTRGLTAGQINNLDSKTYSVDTLVEMYFSVGNLYYTTGDYSTTVTTPTAGSQTFTPSSFITNLGTIKESFMPEPLNVDLQFQRTDTTLNSYWSLNVIGRRVVIYKLFRSITTYAPDTSNGLIQVFDGTIKGMDVDEQTDKPTNYTFRCTSDFGDFQRTRTRMTSSIPGALVSKKILWGDFYL